MDAFEELSELAKQLKVAAATTSAEDIRRPLQAQQDAANQVGRSFSGSWLGYHSRVYYQKFETPPPGTNFSREWGLWHPEGRHGGWRQYNYADVEAHIETLAKHPNLDPARDAARQANEVFDKDKAEMISILETELGSQPDALLSNLKVELEKLEPMSQSDVAGHWWPEGQIFTRDRMALGEGNKVPAHINALAEVASLRHSFDICSEAAKIAMKAASHLERKKRKSVTADRVGTKVFIGHGRSAVWREFYSGSPSPTMGRIQSGARCGDRYHCAAERDA